MTRTYTTYRGYTIEHLIEGFRIDGGSLTVYRSLAKAKAAIDYIESLDPDRVPQATTWLHNPHSGYNAICAD